MALSVQWLALQQSSLGAHADQHCFHSALGFLWASLIVPGIFLGLGWEAFLGGVSGKEPACQFRRHKRHGFDPWVEKIPWRRAWHSHSSILAWRIPMDRGAWQATVHRVEKSQTQLKWLSTAGWKEQRRSLCFFPAFPPPSSISLPSTHLTHDSGCFWSGWNMCCLDLHVPLDLCLLQPAGTELPVFSLLLFTWDTDTLSWERVLRLNLPRWAM